MKMSLKEPMIPLTAGEPGVVQDSRLAFEARRKLGKPQKALLWQWLQGRSRVSESRTAGEAGREAGAGGGEPAPAQPAAGAVAAQPG